ncbi:MAG: hypothetical protein EZS28_039625 [Streblomastix strix]|uniref:Uncharacterized protein n=1 Tax=Streblomastix strix TaxID=222440 RepID=A0A5J4U3I0_9EUKA|nr:MAG: hypothetical protein EZS28_039625 [Streblomastix strix]
MPAQYTAFCDIFTKEKLKSCISCFQCRLGCLQRMHELLTSNVYIVMMIHDNAGFIIVIGILASSLLSILLSFITIHPDFIGDKEYLSPVHVFYLQLIIFVYFIVAFAVICF